MAEQSVTNKSYLQARGCPKKLLDSPQIKLRLKEIL
jgi:hypothetical protein